MLLKAILFISAVASAWHIPDPNPSNETVVFERGFLACHCSGTDAVSWITKQQLGREVQWLNGNYTRLQKELGLNQTEARIALQDQAKTVLNNCFNHSQYQGCINADVSNRQNGSIPLCSYDRTTHRNVARLESGEWVTEGLCPVRVFDPNPQYFSLNSTRHHPGLMWCWCSAGGQIVGPPSQMNNTVQYLHTVLANLTLLSQEEASSRAEMEIRQCLSQFSYAKCVEADRQLRGTFNYSICRYDNVTGRNSGPDFLGDPQGLVTLGHCPDNNDTVVLPIVAQDRGTNAVRAKVQSAAKSKNEGCVAIRHFRKDAVLQHRWHLERDVLCWRSFCATPNHGIYYRGMYTSLGEICRKTRKCIRSRTLVNNLKLMVHRRYRVNAEFVITPYDVRFPWLLIWVVQIAEDLFELFALSTVAGIVISVVHFVVDVLERWGK